MLHRRTVMAVLISAILAIPSMPVMAAVWTDQDDYSPGSVVTISGDNSNFAEGEGYLPGETVAVNVYGPSDWAASCSAEADEDGSWSCTVTLDPDPEVAVGAYLYIATGQDSGTVETGSFTDAFSSETTLSFGPTDRSGAAGFQAYYGEEVEFLGTVCKKIGAPPACVSGSDSNPGGGTVSIGQDDTTVPAGNWSCAGANTYDTIASGISISGQNFSTSLQPKQPHSSALTAGNYWVTAQPSVGKYGFRASYSGTGSGATQVNSSNSGCVDLEIIKAPTTTVGSFNTNYGNPMTTMIITEGATATINWQVKSIYGVTGNTAHGRVNVTPDAGNPGNLVCGANPVGTVSESQTTGTGFTETGNFNCTPDAPGVYEFELAFVDNPGTGSPTPNDGNYEDSTSATLVLIVASPGDSATGGGHITMNGAGRVSFGFTVGKVKDSDPVEYRGQVSLMNNEGWKLKGSIDSYGLVDDCGIASGTGRLSEWDGTEFVLATTSVAFMITFCDAGTPSKKNGEFKSDKFGFTIDYSGTPDNFGSPAELRGGDISMKSGSGTTTVSGGGGGGGKGKSGKLP